MSEDFKRMAGAGGRYGPLVAVLAAAVLAGCTSDDVGPVGTGLPIDMELNPTVTDLVIDVDGYDGLVVTDDESPFDQNEVLYLGGRPDRASSILARYDFSSLMDSVLVRNEGEPIDLTLATIEDVTLRLFLMNSYSETGEKGGSPDKAAKHYRIYSLTDTLDASLYPGPEPAFDEESPLADSDETTDAVFIKLPKTDLLDWVENGQTGLIIRDEGSPSDDLVGYASMELTHYLEIALENENTLVGPTITVEFAPELDIVPVTFRPTQDTCTLHGVADSSPDAGDGIVVRTYARRYPRFSFDLDFPDDDRMINRAVLRVAVDTLSSYGPLASLVLAAVPTDLVAGRDSLTVQEIEASAELLAGLNSVDVNNLDDATSPWLGFDITSIVQRQANGLLDDEPFSFLLTSGEDFFSGYSSSWDPDFYLTLMSFYGADDVDHRPYLEITYTVFTGGGK